MRTHSPSSTSFTSSKELTTDRLTLKPWRVEDARAALCVYGHVEVTRWLSPDLDRVPNLTSMRSLLRQWIADDARLSAPAGRWALRRNSDGRVIGGTTLLPLPPGNEHLEIAWQLHPDTWGHGYASETTRALAAWAFGLGAHEIVAVVQPGNTRAAATVRHNGMHWIGETTKYFDIALQVFRLRAADLDRTARNGHRRRHLGH